MEVMCNSESSGDEQKKEQKSAPQKTPHTSMSQILGRYTVTLDADKRKQDIWQANAFQQEKDTVI